MSKKQALDPIHLKIGKVLGTIVIADIIYFIALHSLPLDYSGYSFLVGVVISGVLVGIFIKETNLGKIIYAMLTIVIMLSFGWLPS